MAWLQLRVHASRDNSNRIEDALLHAGAASVTFEDAGDQPILEPALGETPLWNHTRVTGLFSADTDTDLATVTATAALGETLPCYQWEILEDRNWEREWMEHFQPIQCGPRLWICPSWRQPPDPSAVNLMLDPGLAFGTGTHPTTALCLRWLDQCNLDNALVVDYGCGSGILGIAALLLGARKVIAVDNDPQALQATLDNARRNAIDTSKIDVHLPAAAPTDIVADVTLANILAEPLLGLAPLLSGLTRPGGALVLSGIITSQSPALRKRYNEWFELQPDQQEEGWICLTGQRRKQRDCSVDSLHK